MDRKELLEEIYTQFDLCAQQFCADTNGHFCALSREYSGECLAENLKYCFAKITYHSHVIKFIYTAHSIMGVVNSVLGCSVCFGKAEDSVEIPLPLLTDYCDLDVSSPMFVPLITNGASMVQAFSCLEDTLRQLISLLERISHDETSKTKILSAYAEEISAIFDLDEVESVNNQPVYDFFTLRFTTEAFLNALKGKYGKAVKQLKKVKEPTGYETRLLRLWQAGEYGKTVELSLIVQNAELYNSVGVQKADLKEFSVLFVSWLMMTPVISAVYLVLFYLLVCMEGRGSVYLMGPSYNYPICILFGFVTAIVASYFTRHRFYKLLHKKDYERYREMDAIQNHGGSDRLMRVVLTLVVVICIFGAGLMARWNLNFLADGFADNTKFLSFRGEYYSYSEIESVDYKADRVNGFGEILDYPSYVLQMKDGREIDLYEYGEISDYEGILLELFEEQGVKILRSKS